MTETFSAVQSGHQIQQLPLSKTYGEEIAARFTNEAYKTLKQDELKQSRDFLIIDPGQISLRNGLHENMARRLQNLLRSRGARVSEDRNRLACPIGSRRRRIRPYYELPEFRLSGGPSLGHDNASIQASAAKGLSEKSTFCYDRHWHAESSPSVEVYVQRNLGRSLSAFYTTPFLTILRPRANGHTGDIEMAWSGNVHAVSYDSNPGFHLSPTTEHVPMLPSLLSCGTKCSRSNPA